MYLGNNLSGLRGTAYSYDADGERVVDSNAQSGGTDTGGATDRDEPVGGCAQFKEGTVQYAKCVQAQNPNKNSVATPESGMSTTTMILIGLAAAVGIYFIAK